MLLPPNPHGPGMGDEKYLITGSAKESKYKMSLLTSHEMQSQTGFHNYLSKHVQTSQALTYRMAMTVWLQFKISWTPLNPALSMDAR